MDQASVVAEVQIAKSFDEKKGYRYRSGCVADRRKIKAEEPSLQLQMELFADGKKFKIFSKA